MSKGTHWTAEEIAELRRLARAGITQQKTLARRLNRSAGSVYQKLREHCSAYLPDKRIYRPRPGRTALPTIEPRQPWKPGDPKPDWLRRDT